MRCSINEAVVHYVEHDGGVPLVALHGAGVDHREIEAAVEAVVPGPGYRRIYPDLPGMGRSTAEGLTCNDDVVALLAGFIERVGAGPVMLLGHSYGAYPSIRPRWSASSPAGRLAPARARFRDRP